ncbi:leucine-rich repeat-containing protein 31 isoform X2 [Bombina bombina]|uniref:leucine-rich repeat-containing protein 31 isoform X2 n=1 Tax=Bombina bombina TaxID=8345 RepID=UPI00235B1E38|nr:leucine-rich repeat-containing protein 31 isoform X2 [Bombina bombina]
MDTNDKEDSQKKSEDVGQRRSPFDLFFNPRKKSTKGKNELFSMNRFFKAFERETEKAPKEKEPQDSQDKTSTHDNPDVDVNTPGKEETQLPGLDISGWWKVKQFMQRFGKKAESNCINLNNCGLTAMDMEELGTLLAFIPDTEEIDLSWNDLIGGSIRLLTPYLQQVGKLKIFSLSNCSLTPNDVNALGEALEHIPLLESLDLSWNSDLGGNLSRLTQHISTQCELKALYLTECNVRAADAHALNKMPNLEVLDLSMNKDIGSIIRTLIDELKTKSSLSVLKLHGTGLQQETIQSLSDVFHNWPYLRKLDLSCNKEAGGGFKEAAARLTTFKHLELLDIHQCCLSGDDVDALTQVVPLLSNLQVLNISSNKMVGHSPEHLFSRLRFLPKLKCIIVSSCSLKKESFSALAEASRYLVDLEILDLSWNKCIGGNLKLLLDTLKTATKLQSLMLSSCDLVTQDLAVLASAAQAGYLDSLQHLDLAYNDTIADEGWALFFESLYAINNITELDVSLRPGSTRDCGAWVIHLLSSMLKLPKLKELGMQRWVLSAAEQQQLERINKESMIHIYFE